MTRDKQQQVDSLMAEVRELNAKLDERYLQLAQCADEKLELRGRLLRAELIMEAWTDRADRAREIRERDVLRRCVHELRAQLPTRERREPALLAARVAALLRQLTQQPLMIALCEPEECAAVEATIAICERVDSERATQLLAAERKES